MQHECAHYTFGQTASEHILPTAIQFRVRAGAQPAIPRHEISHPDPLISKPGFFRLFIILCALVARSSGAQTSAPAGASPVFVGGELEQYLRYSQTMGATRSDPWSLRNFSQTQAVALQSISGVHPWSGRFASREARSGLTWQLLPASVSLTANSAFPFGNNDGPVWTGKGLTTVLSGGISASWSGFTLTLAPQFFRAENSAFALMFNGQSGTLQYADGQFPDLVDRPQRFGNAAYQRLDPGQSTFRYDGFGVTAGVSTANQSWGPSDRYQYLLGNNAGGFPHVFVGSQHPLNVGFGHIHGRILWGTLGQSDFSPVTGPEYFVDGVQSGTRRFAAGMVATLQPRGITGLELGAARFFHGAWPKDGLARGDFTALFQNIFKRGLPTEPSLPGSDNTKGVRDNQLFSVFARWVVPGAGFEAYGEFGREDHSWDIRDFLLEPDHGGASRLLGIRKMWKNGYALRAEAINYEAPQLTRVRAEGAVYIHYVLRQGHTVNGQPLGADVGLGSGAGSTLAVDRYAANGRTSIEWSRAVARERGIYIAGGITDTKAVDVLHTLSLQALRFRGPVDLTGKVNLTMNLNRYFSFDKFNAGAQFGAAFRF